MKKYLARRLRRAANRLDPPTIMPVFTLDGMTSTGATNSFTVANFRFSPEAADRRAVRKHGRALRLLRMK